MKNGICLIETKSHFQHNKEVENPPNFSEKVFEKTVKDMLNNLIIFEQLFTDIVLQYERIRMILFYDLVKKANYEKIMEEIFTKYKYSYKYIN